MVSISVINRLLISMVAISPLFADASNTTNKSFNKAKKQLLTVCIKIIVKPFIVALHLVLKDR